MVKLATSAHLILLVQLSLFGIFGCRMNHKEIGPEPAFPDGGTRLYFADCDPFHWNRETIDLTADPAAACDGNILFRPANNTRLAIWQSNRIRVQGGSLKEGCHLVFSRSSQQAAAEGILSVTYAGIGVNFCKRIALPVGELSKVFDFSEYGTTQFPMDSLVRVQIQIYDSTLQLDTVSTAALSTVSGTGSYVYVGCDPSTICDFYIYLGLANGVGAPNSAYNVAFLNSNGNVDYQIFFENMGGAEIVGNSFRFGPRYGLAYLAAESNGCRDTATFFAYPPPLSFQTDTLGDFPYWSRNFVSDASTVWFWELIEIRYDTVSACSLNVVYRTEWPFFSRRIYGCQPNFVSVYYDQIQSHFWVLQHGVSDTLWGYTYEGHFDSTLIAYNVGNILYRQKWINIVSEDNYLLHTTVTSFAGGSPISIADVPRELASGFSGRAGITKPNNYLGTWYINVFDDSAHWLAKFPILPEYDNEVISDLKILQSDSDIVYQATVDTLYEGFLYGFPIKYSIRSLINQQVFANSEGILPSFQPIDRGYHEHSAKPALHQRSRMGAH
jgi:hypothetical protein